MRQRLVEEGLEAALAYKYSPASARPRIFDGEKEAKLIALACSRRPRDGRAGPCSCWRTGRGTPHCRSRQRQHDWAHAKKTLSSPIAAKSWVIPPKANSAFVAAMEDVLAVYHPAARCRSSAGLPGRDLKATPRRDARADPDESRATRPFDYEYERNGTANLFMMFAPLEGWRHVKVTDRHTAVDYAHVLKDLADVHFPAAPRSFWSRTISTSTARRRSTKPSRPPKPGGWSNDSNGITRQSTAAGSIWPSPNSASCLRQCLDRRIPDKQTLTAEVATWQDDRNKKHAKADWQFATADARVKLKRLYPAM